MSDIKQLKALRDAKAGKLKSSYAKAKDYNDRHCKTLTRKIVKSVKEYVNSDAFSDHLTDHIKTDIEYATNTTHLYDETYECELMLDFSAHDTSLPVRFWFEIGFDGYEPVYRQQFETEMYTQKNKRDNYKIKPDVDWCPLYKSCSEIVVNRLNELGFTVVKVEDRSHIDLWPKCLGWLTFTF